MTTSATETKNEPVSVDPGDLYEVCQAANAWASYLRQRAGEAYDTSLPTSAAADRIDKAAHNLREQSYKQ